MKYAIIIFLFAVSAMAQDKVVENVSSKTITIKGKQITVNESSKNVAKWRFVHDGKEIKAMPFFSGSHTASIFTIAECDSYDALLKRIKELGLKVTDEQQKELDDIAERVKRGEM